jgi:hypothetical protein
MFRIIATMFRTIATVLSIAIILSPIVAAQQVSSCSYPEATCETCVRRWKPSSNARTGNKVECTWCGSLGTNSSDPDFAGLCFFADDVITKEKCGTNPIFQGKCTANTVSLNIPLIVGIPFGLASAASATTCYAEARVATGRDRLTKWKWLFIGLLLPLISIVLVCYLQRKGHFNSSAHAQSSAPSGPAPLSAPHDSVSHGAPRITRGDTNSVHVDTQSICVV